MLNPALRRAASWAPRAVIEAQILPENEADAIRQMGWGEWAAGMSTMR